MKTWIKRLFSVCLLVALMATAGCSLSTLISPEDDGVEDTPAAQVENSPESPEATAADVQAEEPVSATETEAIVPTEAEAPAQTEEATEAPVAEATDAPVITHSMVPVSAVYFGKQYIFECNTGYNFASSDNYRIPRACDSWRNNLLERPISQDLLTFYPYLDILNAMAGYDPDWYFVSFNLFDGSNPVDGTPFYYFVELDKNFDGRGDYLVVVENLVFNETEWSVDRLQVWEDTNKDVGSFNAVFADAQNAGDGYDLLIFDQGVGDDPDLAWVRRNPTQPSQIEFAIKRTLFADKQSFIWWVGTLQGVLNPSAFDLVDSQSEGEFFAVDTTCGWPLGRNGTGYPKQCYVPLPTAVPTNQPAPKFVCVRPPRPNPDPCWIWMEEDCEWVCFN
ncbi:MAG: hypothetical protein V2J07_03970 [Anaerolineae bacterium]|jgi:hypothetical protein|nr:hypothetical protein [Anaerolineae bacterium]